MASVLEKPGEVPIPHSRMHPREPIPLSVKRSLAGPYLLIGVVGILGYRQIADNPLAEIVYLAVLASAVFATVLGSVRNRPSSLTPL